MKENKVDIFNKEEHWWNPDHLLYKLKEFNPPRFDYFGQFIRDWKNMKVIDIGCGGGYTSEYAAQKGALVTGIDIAPESIKAAKNHANQNNLGISYHVGDANKLPFEDSTFDVAICVDVLEHVPNPEGIIREAYRVLKKRGQLFFDTINKTMKSKIIIVWLCENIIKQIPKGSHNWEYFIPVETMMKMLEETGFCDIECKGFNMRGKELQFYFNNDTSMMYIGRCLRR